jgi:hypothetical protein
VRLGGKNKRQRREAEFAEERGDAAIEQSEFEELKEEQSFAV